MNRTLIRKAFVALAVLACVGLIPAPAFAEYPEQGPAETPSAAAMAVDLLLVRPLGVASTIVGTGVFVLSLPFSLLGGNVDEAARMLVAEPAAYTFARPLGEFD